MTSPHSLLDLWIAHCTQLVQALGRPGDSELIVVERSRWQRTDESLLLESRRVRRARTTVSSDVVVSTSQSLPTYSKLMTAMKEDHRISRHIAEALHGNFWMVTHDLDGLIVDPVWDVVSGNETAGQDLRTRCQALHADLLAETITTRTISPLVGLGSRSEEISLAEGLVVRRLNDEELCAAADVGLFRQHVGTNKGRIHSPPLFGLVLTQVEEKRFGAWDPPRLDEQSDEAGDAIRRAVRALRLTKQGIVHHLGAMHRIENTVVNRDVEWASSAFVTHTHMSGAYDLLKSDEPAIQKVFTALGSPHVQSRHFLEVALRRYDAALTRSEPEDALLDLMIAAEALFLTETGVHAYRGELRFRLALRAARFIDWGNDARQTFRVMRLAYDLRSAIVHGSSSPSVPQPYGSVTRFNWTLSELLRLSCGKYVGIAATTPGKGSVLPKDEDVLAPSTEPTSLPEIGT